MVVTMLWGSHFAAVSLLGFAATEPFKVGLDGALSNLVQRKLSLPMAGWAELDEF